MKRKSVYVARDLDGTLAIFPEKPVFDDKTGSWLNMEQPSYCVVPETWCKNLEPGAGPMRVYGFTYAKIAEG